MARYINLTPRWAEILPTWRMMLESAYRGDASNPDLIIANAWDELKRMAEAADRYGDLLAALRDEGAGEEQSNALIEAMLKRGRELQDADRNTIKEG